MYVLLFNRLYFNNKTTTTIIFPTSHKHILYCWVNT